MAHEQYVSVGDEHETTDSVATEEEVVARLAASVVHELRNPLTSVYGYAQLLREAEPGDQAEYIQTILTELDRVREVLGTIGRLVPQDVAATSERHALAPLVEEAVRRALESSGRVISLRSTLAEHLYVTGCRDDLVWALRAVIENAIQSLDGRSHLWIRSAWTATDIYVHVGNTTRRVSGDVLRHAFRPFYSAQEGRLGLGLPVVQRIMADHGGKVCMQGLAGHVLVTLAFPMPSDRQL